MILIASFLKSPIEDAYENIKLIQDDLDTSNYPETNNSLFSNKNKKVIGKFKDELDGQIMFS